MQKNVSGINCVDLPFWDIPFYVVDELVFGYKCNKRLTILEDRL